MKPRRLTIAQFDALKVHNPYNFFRRGCFWVYWDSHTWHRGWYLQIPSYPNPDELGGQWRLNGHYGGKFEIGKLRPEIEKILKAAPAPFPWPEGGWTPIFGVKVPKIYYDKFMAYWNEKYEAIQQPRRLHGPRRRNPSVAPRAHGPIDPRGGLLRLARRPASISDVDELEGVKRTSITLRDNRG